MYNLQDVKKTFHLDANKTNIESSTLPSNSTTLPSGFECEGTNQTKSDSSWPFRSQSTDRSLIRRSMHLYLESAHNANQGIIFCLNCKQGIYINYNTFETFWL